MVKQTVLNGDYIQQLLAYSDNQSVHLVELTYQSPVYLVFLRHLGCIFCKEAVEDISKNQLAIKELGYQLVFVHMASRDIADAFLRQNNLAGYPHLSDPDCRLYAHFGLVRGSLNQLFGLRVLMRGVKAGWMEGRGVGLPFIGDGFQMPGLFIIHRGTVIEAFIHQYASDRPDYVGIANCCAFD